MIHTEHLRKADESWEIIHDNEGNAIHFYHKDGTLMMFPTLDDLIKRIYLGDMTAQYTHIDLENYENDPDIALACLHDYNIYNYYELGKLIYCD